VSREDPAEGLPRVYVNCPFDRDFRPQLEAIVFSCVHAGLYPVLATSSGKTGEPRLQRILAELMKSRYSIHDLSRCRGEGDENLARFNMPLELGMAMALRVAAPGMHEYLILVPDQAQLYRRYISDLGGLDPQTHDGTPQRIVGEVLAWLLSAADAPADVSPDEVIRKLPSFGDAMRSLEQSWHGAQPPWAHVVRLAAAIARGA
jgi:hypothetical protein